MVTKQLTLDKLSDGEVVILPGDGTYTMNCNIFNKDAIKKMYLLKEKNMGIPFSVSVASLDVLDSLLELNEQEKQIIHTLIKDFWPGQLTIMMPCKDRIDLVYVKNKTIAVNSPKHPIQRYILNELGAPMITTSANTYGEACYTDLESVKKKYTKLPVHIDETLPIKPSGLEDTIVKVKNNRVGIMRLGIITQKQIVDSLEGLPVEIGKYLIPIPVILNKNAVFAQFICGDSLDHSFHKNNMVKYVKEYLNRSILVDFGKRNYEKKELCLGYVDFSEEGNIEEAIFNFYNIIRQLNAITCNNIIFVDVYRNNEGLYNVLIDKIDRACNTKSIFIPMSYD